MVVPELAMEIYWEKNHRSIAGGFSKLWSRCLEASAVEIVSATYPGMKYIPSLGIS